MNFYYKFGKFANGGTFQGSIVSGPRLAVPISQVQNSRVITASHTSSLANQRIPVVSASQTPHSTVLASTSRLVTSQPSGNVVGRLTVNPAAVSIYLFNQVIKILLHQAECN